MFINKKNRDALKAHVKAALADLDDDVVGVGIGNKCVNVYVSNADIAAEIPAEIDNIPIKTIVTGKIVAQ